MGTVSILQAKTPEEFAQILQDAGSVNVLVPAPAEPPQKTTADMIMSVSQSLYSQLVVVHFYADWAPQCQQMNDVLQEFSKDAKFKKCKFVKVEAESVPEISQKHNITAVPTCLLLKGGTEVERINGANVPELTKKVGKHATSGVAAAAPKQDLNTRLKKLVNSAPVMLFMKGDVAEPRCGFSKQLVAILAEQKVKYDSFNILADEEVRQGLKKFSDWPTFPQLYANGEFIGGLDIVKELVETGELASQLPKQQSLEERLKEIINRDRVMLFMKGNPEVPRCGFSKTVVELMSSTGTKYSTFDILEDDEVRQGLKKYSNWPTYPQVYVKGEFVGGLDILKELQESGELESTLNAD